MSKGPHCPEEHLELHTKTAGSWRGSTSDGPRAETRQQDVTTLQPIASALKCSCRCVENALKQQASVSIVRLGEKTLGLEQMFLET